MFTTRGLAPLAPTSHAPPLPVAPAPGTNQGSGSGGLGRGLAGILDQSRARPRVPGSGLEQLLGRQPTATPPRVRQFVTDTALAVIAEGFEAEAVVIARREGPDRLPAVSSRVPPSWDDSCGLTFELFGQLWQLIDSDDPDAPRSRLVRLGGLHGWITRQATAAGVLGAAVIRSRPFDPAEEAILSRVIRSVTVAVGGEGLDPAARSVLSASVEAERDGWRAEVTLAGQRATGRGSRSELAVARAAAGLSRVPCEVAFAGRTRVDEAEVAVVVVNDHESSPLLGLSVSDRDPTVGPAEAVLAAMAGVGHWCPRTA